MLLISMHAINNGLTINPMSFSTCCVCLLQPPYLAILLMTGSETELLSSTSGISGAAGDAGKSLTNSRKEEHLKTMMYTLEVLLRTRY